MSLCAADVMQTKVHTVRGDLSLPELERAFLKERVSGFLVVDGKRLVGVVSRSDVVRKLAAEQSLAEYVSDYHRDLGGFGGGEDAESLVTLASRAGSRLGSATVADLMSKTPIRVAPDDSLRDVATVLSKHRIHRVPVVHGETIAGIITSMNLVDLIAKGRLE
jgi:CBS domain-containing protein